MKTLYICSHCNSDNVQIKAWVEPNNNNQYVEEVDTDDLGWCCDCEKHSVIDTTLLKDDAKIIGYQVVGEDGTSNDGDIHPMMDGSFCVYNLSQANEMLKNKNEGQWGLSTIWNDDIEEPTMMFKGNPRD